jgi:hypothetical protein
MDNRYSANLKVCATCSFWMGERTVNFGRNLAVCTPGTKGDCHEGGMLKRQKMNNASCSKWQKWGGMK